MPRIDYSKYAVHKKVNPAIMAICYAQGWAANENYMTFKEAATITDVGTAFKNKKVQFNEFQYFTGVTSIASQSMSSINSIILPESLTSIGYAAFYWSNIKELRIPKHITVTGVEQILSRNTVFEKIIWDADAYPSYSSLNTDYSNPNFTIISSNNTLYHCQDGCIWSADKIKLYVVPQGAFSNFHFLGTENIIGDTFFALGIDGKMTIPSTVTDFKTYRRYNNFTKCRITELDMSTCSVGENTPATRNCTFTTYRFPICSKISNIGIVLGGSVKNLIFNQLTPPILTRRFNGENITNIFVPDAAVETYKSATIWTNYADRIKPISEYVDIWN